MLLRPETWTKPELPAWSHHVIVQKYQLILRNFVSDLIVFITGTTLEALGLLATVHCKTSRLITMQRLKEEEMILKTALRLSMIHQ